MLGNKFSTILHDQSYILINKSDNLFNYFGLYAECPICNQIMRSDYPDNLSRDVGEVYIKTCTHYTHTLNFLFQQEEHTLSKNYSLKLIMFTYNDLRLLWEKEVRKLFFTKDTITVFNTNKLYNYMLGYTTTARWVELPWVDPELLDAKKLYKKINNYINLL